MSTWTTKSLNRNIEYIVIKHLLPSINHSIMGVKFRAGYAVVEKGSKTYFNLKKTPFLKDSKEFPISFLQKLSFITRASDVKIIYGIDVYNYYIKKLTEKLNKEKIEQKVLQEKEHIESSDRCTYRNDGFNSISAGELCKRHRAKESPSGYCFLHILYDPKLNIELPMAMTKEERRKLIQKVLKDTKKYLKSE